MQLSFCLQHLAVSDQQSGSSAVRQDTNDIPPLITDAVSDVIDHGVALSVMTFYHTWAKQQMWAPDAAYKNGKYLSLDDVPWAKEQMRSSDGACKNVSNKPSGPFKDKAEIPGITSYRRQGCPNGGQRPVSPDKKLSKESCTRDTETPRDLVILAPETGKLFKDMLRITEASVFRGTLGSKRGKPVLPHVLDRRFFPLPCLRYFGKNIYLLYSTRDTKILDPVDGWTTHGIVEYKGNGLFFADAHTSHERIVKYEGQGWQDLA
ncbi:hypothetical protein CEK25_012387 [Fusarium fujikuroi]|nr:hypothetical protein CEK25_012387 [Fusarium fujikuroi]